MKLLFSLIFSDFEDKILKESYYPENALEMLQARFTAMLLLQNPNPDVVNQAECFINKTSIFTESDLSFAQAFVSKIKIWSELQVCSFYTSAVGDFIEYKIFFMTQDNQAQFMHFHLRYEVRDGHCYFISQNLPLIRVIGDPILQKPGIAFSETPTTEQQNELAAQIELAKSILIQTSGAGIAANQCAGIENPYCFTIVGVFYESPEHVMGVQRRYPGTNFPQAKIMVNPVIVAVSEETQNFNHACLSVPCANRCAVVSPMKMQVRYQDPMDEMKTKDNIYDGIDAVVLWHELTHIIYGKTYIDVTFESLSVEDLLQFQKMLMDEIEWRKEDYSYIPELSVPPFHFSVKISEDGIQKLDHTELAAVLPKISEETLYGLLKQADALLKKKINTSNELVRVSPLSVFPHQKTKAISALPIVNISHTL